MIVYRLFTQIIMLLKFTWALLSLILVHWVTPWKPWERPREVTEKETIVVWKCRSWAKIFEAQGYWIKIWGIRWIDQYLRREVTGPIWERRNRPLRTFKVFGCDEHGEGHQKCDLLVNCSEGCDLVPVVVCKSNRPERRILHVNFLWSAGMKYASG